MKRFILSALLFLFPVSVFAYQSPGSPTGHINDFAGVLSADAKTQIESTFSAYEQQTSNQIAVAIISELGDETIETYAVRLYQEWGIGKKGEDNGALFLVSVQDREMRIEVGYGLEGELTDIESKQIVDNVVPPYFKAGDFDGGVTAATQAMIQAIGGTLESPGPKASRSLGKGRGFPLGDYFWVLIALFMWLTSILARSRSWWLGGVIGGIVGLIIWLVWSFLFALPILVVFGLVFDYIVSTKYKHAAATGNFHGLWWMGGGRHRWDRGGRGGWGGFGGGLSGGGGASGRW